VVKFSENTKVSPKSYHKASQILRKREGSSEILYQNFTNPPKTRGILRNPIRKFHKSSENTKDSPRILPPAGKHTQTTKNTHTYPCNGCRCNPAWLHQAGLHFQPLCLKSQRTRLNSATAAGATPTSWGMQPTSWGVQPTSCGMQPTSWGATMHGATNKLGCLFFRNERSPTLNPKP